MSRIIFPFELRLAKAGRRRLETTYLKSHTNIGAANAVLKTTEGVVVVVVVGFWIQAWERGGHVCLHPCLSLCSKYMLDAKLSPGLYTVT